MTGTRLWRFLAAQSAVARMGFRALCFSFFIFLCFAHGGQAQEWQEIARQGRGQTVWFHAWGGSQTINAYIDWAAERVKAEYNIELRHVRVRDAAESVRQVLAEKTAGRTEKGAIDLIWINGENFKSMKENGLLFGPFAEQLPNFAYVGDKDSVRFDFTVPIEGYESPWGKARLVFIYDSANETAPPRSLAEFAAYARAHPGRLSWPAPPNFIGSTFLKQVLYGLIADDSVLLSPPASDREFSRVATPLWQWIEEIRPFLWRRGRAWPRDGEVLKQMLNDGAVDLAISFNPGDASSAIAQGQLPPSVRSYVWTGGTVGNAHFVAIPFNSSAKQGAQLVANFLLSPEAQLQKQNPDIWGDPTVLDVNLLPALWAARFRELKRGVATLPPDALGPALAEPHPEWMTRIEKQWQERYGS